MKHTKELFDLTGRVAIVTGGRGLYGASISLGLCEMGATVVIASRSGEKCEEYAKTLRQQGYEAYGMSLDLSNDASIHSFTEEVYRKFGHIDILVNNAVDRRNMVSLQDATRQKLQDSADVNLNGQILLSQAVLEYMIPQKKGSIINISSIRGLDCPHFPFYPDTWGDQQDTDTTEKWAMEGLTKYMAGRYGKNGIRVNCIAPGGFNPGLADDPSKQAFQQTYIENCPLGCWANEDDIKGPVAFLASDASGYVTGATLVMDGGWTIW
ncbi:MAG: SDR family oxidoreductase [Ruminococcaceae bacterium]|nr:SDR family oxidoreductase [Oscillospiraceae bacterium]